MTKLKWCIKRTPENYKEVNEWANKVHSEPFQFGNEYRSMIGYVHSDLQDHGSLSHEHKNNHYTEITLDEFRLLTDPEKRKKIISLWGHSESNERWAFTNEGCVTISFEVYNELSRLFAESLNEEIPIKDRDMSGIMGLLPNPKFHVDDFKTESEAKTLKLLKKINRKLNRILKRQKEQF